MTKRPITHHFNNFECVIDNEPLYVNDKNESEVSKTLIVEFDNSFE